MDMRKREVAEMLYEFITVGDLRGPLAGMPPEDCTDLLVSYLSDLSMVRATIRDIEKLKDEFEIKGIYMAEIEPLLRGLREIARGVGRRVIGDTGYEVMCAIPLGDKEIVLAEDEGADDNMRWLICDYTQGGQYEHCIITGKYFAALSELTRRIDMEICSLEQNN